MEARWRVHAVLGSIQLAFSLWHIVGSAALRDGTNAIVFALYREILASILMIAMVRWLGHSLHVRPEHRLRYAFLGFCSFANVVLFVLGLKWAGAAVAAMMQPLVPIIALCMSVSVGLERLTALKVAGVCVSVSGAVILEASQLKGGSTATSWGMAALFAQVTAVSALLTFQKPMLEFYPPAVNTAVYYTLGSCFTAVVAAATAFDTSPSDWTLGGTAIALVALAYATVFATAYTYSAYSWVIKRASPSTVALYCTLQSVCTPLLSVAFLHDTITGVEVLSGGLICMGLAMGVKGAEGPPARPKGEEVPPDAQGLLSRKAHDYRTMGGGGGEGA